MKFVTVQVGKEGVRARVLGCLRVSAWEIEGGGERGRESEVAVLFVRVYRVLYICVCDAVFQASRLSLSVLALSVQAFGAKRNESGQKLEGKKAALKMDQCVF